MKYSLQSLIPFLLFLLNHLGLPSPELDQILDNPLKKFFFIWTPFTFWQLIYVKVKVTLRLTVSQSVSLGVEPHLGLMTRYLFLFDSYVLVSVGRPLWREDGSVFCMCRWPLPAQLFSGTSPLGLATVFYCIRFETSLFVASYDSHGHGGGIRPCLHTGAQLIYAAEDFFITTLHGPRRKQAFSVKVAWLLFRCLAMDVLFLRAFASVECVYRVVA
jgi:hypothetical protein